MVWVTAAIQLSLMIMLVGLTGVILVNGLPVFWPSNLERHTLDDGRIVLGELMETNIGPRGPRRRIKVGNKDLGHQPFVWIDDSSIVDSDAPREAVVLERQQDGNFYGFLRGLNSPDGTVDAPTWSAFLAKAHESREAFLALEERREVLSLKDNDIARLKRERKSHAEGSEATRRLDEERAGIIRDNEQELEVIGREIRRVMDHKAVFGTADGVEYTLPLCYIVRAWRPNEMGVLDKGGFYLDRFWELFVEDPRESNTEGGLFPAIIGTVFLVLLMSPMAFIFGTMAGVYIAEYATDGPLLRFVRISVNNLAGIPSIVFGIFGLGFFVYVIGANIDSLFYPDYDEPVFGTGGILWASLTLALLNLPVVIVATEESLRTLNPELKNGSLALGATRLQTLLRVQLPTAAPGILTGFILAMARAAGEVAPLMITGVVKLAPALPVDGTFPFFHLDRKFMHLGFHIYDVGFQSPDVEAAKPMVFVTALLLVGIVFVMNFTAMRLRQKLRDKLTVKTI